MAGINSFFWLLITAHLIGDFYLQSGGLACSKKEKLSSLFVHSGLYALPLLVVMLPFIGGDRLWLFIAFAAITVSHGMIDFIKVRVCAKYTDKESLAFFIDQFLHIAVILAASFIYTFHAPAGLYSIEKSLPVAYISVAAGIPFDRLIRIFCAFLLIFKPANIIIKILKPLSNQNDSPQETASIKAGGMIGNLERILMLILLMYGQYTAIAFILTAKSITRYNKIVESPSFAEYYLIGTLSSVIIAVLASLIAK